MLAGVSIIVVLSHMDLPVRLGFSTMTAVPPTGFTQEKQTLAAGQVSGIAEWSNAAVRRRPTCYPVDPPKGYHAVSRGQIRGTLRSTGSAPLTRRGRAMPGRRDSTKAPCS